jgi:hypothetical protein
MAETQSTTTTTTTEATAPTGDIKVFIDTFNKDFDTQLKSLLDAQQNYKNIYADAIKISTPKKGQWPNDPKVVTIGDLFKYTFPDINSDNVVKPNKDNLKEYKGWLNDLRDSEDEKIKTMYDKISDGISSNKQIENYQNLKKPGVTNPSLWSPGQYYFDVFMSLMLSPYGPLKDPSNSNGGSAFGVGVSASVSSFNSDGVGATGSFGYFTFYEIIEGGNVDVGIKYKINSLTGINIHLDDASTKPPKSFTNLLTQYKTGLLSEFISIENGEIILKDEKFNIYEGIITDPLDKEVEIQDIKLLTDITGYKFIGYYEHMLLYKSFIQAGDNYKSIVLPLEEIRDEPPVELPKSQVVRTPSSELQLKFNVERTDTFVVVGSTASPAQEFTIVPNNGSDFIIENDNFNTSDDELGEEYQESEFIGEEEALELAQAAETYGDLQSELPSNTSPSTLNVSESNIDYNDPSFKGADWKNFNIATAVSKINGTSFKPSSKFVESLKKVLYLIKNDEQISDLREAAYILGTAYAESGYSLQRWEADYACTGAGIPYGSSGPCSKATNYYRSSNGKKNYYTLGLDSKGQCFFGRGLIQLTGKGNYEKYGSLIGVNLLGNGDLAMDPINSYKVASVYMRGRTFKHVLANNLTQARKSVNGGTKGINEVNGAYNAWLKALKESKSGATA